MDASPRSRRSGPPQGPRGAAASAWRAGAVWVLALTPSLLALLLCRVPSFDLLDYHACLALSPVVGLCAAELWWRRAAGRGDEGAAPNVRARHVALLLAGPVGVYAAAAAVVPNCAPLTGLLFYLLGPVCSSAVGACMAAVAAAISTRRRRPVWWALAAASLVPGVWHFLTAPQVFGYHGLLGWVGGALYEDALAPHAGYAWFRLLDTATWLAAAIAAHQLLGRGRSAGRGRQLGAVALLTTVAGLAAHAALGEPLGWRVTGAHVRAQLGAHADVYLRPRDGDRSREPDVRVTLLRRAGWQRDARLVAEDVGVRWLELRRFFGAAPSETIEVFVYPDVARKRRWMGAARVEMAKPWLRQVHIVWPGFGASITRHELAHVFAGVDAPLPFRVPLRRGVWPDAVLIEGVAVAAEWPVRMGLNPHHWSAAMRRLKLAPSLERLLQPTGFFAQSSARAYTLAGSLLRWIRDTYGPEALRRVTATADLAGATGVPLPELIARWQGYVDALPLTAVDLERARARFERPGLFVRPCTLEIGRCRERARAAWRRAAPDDALRQWTTLERSLARGAGGVALGVDIALSVAYAAGRNHDPADALDRLDRRVAEGGLTTTQQARVDRLRGDLLMAQGRVTAARAAWRRANIPALSAGARRLLDVKVHLSAQGEPGRTFVRDGLLPFGRRTSFGRALRSLVKASPADPVTRYLAARRGTLGPRRARQMAKLADLSAALAGTWPRLQRACFRLLARDAARRGDCAAVSRWANAALAAPGADARAGGRAEVEAWRQAAGSRCSVQLPERWLSLRAASGPR